jgi:hypothetical protein
MPPVPSSRATLLATVTAMAVKVAPLRTSDDPDAIRLRLTQVARTAVELTQLLSQYDLGEALDRAAETLAAHLAEYCTQFAQNPPRSAAPLQAVCGEFTQLLCQVYEAVLTTAES